MHRPRAPLSFSAGPLPAPSLDPSTVPVHRYRSLPRSPPCTFPCTVCVHRYRSLPLPLPYTRAPSPCTFPCTRAPSPCTLIALCPCPFPTPVHRPRAPLSLSAPVPSLPLPYTRATSPCTVRLVPLPSAPRSFRTRLPLRLLFPDASAYVGFVIALWRLTVLNENPTPEGFWGINKHIYIYIYI